MLHGRHPEPERAKYDLKYYVEMGKDLKSAGAHVLGLKDMAGLLKPAAARVLVKALKEEVGLPIHFHTHDTSGIACATILAASEAACDAVDCAMDAFSGGTSQAKHLALSSKACVTRIATPGIDIEAVARSRLLGSSARPICRVRNGLSGPCIRSILARNARRSVHQPKGAGAFTGI